MKQIEILEANSEETLCFSARLYINGAFASTVHNNEQGEANRYYFDDKKIREEFFSYCRSLPDFESPYGPLPADEDMVIGESLLLRSRKSKPLQQPNMASVLLVHQWDWLLIYGITYCKPNLAQSNILPCFYSDKSLLNDRILIRRALRSALSLAILCSSTKLRMVTENHPWENAFRTGHYSEAMITRINELLIPIHISHRHNSINYRINHSGKYEIFSFRNQFLEEPSNFLFGKNMLF